MSELSALALYPLWAVAVWIALTVLRLGRSTGVGLVVLALVMAGWVCALILFQHEDTTAIGERALPVGMLLAGAFVHAGSDVVGLRRRWLLGAAYAWGVAVAATGAVWPGAFYEPALTAPGPLFWPVAMASAAGVVLTQLWLVRAARVTSGRGARLRWALALGAFAGTLGGGVAVTGRVLAGFALVWAAPPLLLSIGLIAYAILGSERGRSRRLVQQGLVYAAMTAALAAVGITLYIEVLPALTPGAGRSLVWIAIVTLFATLPLDAARMLLADLVGRRLFPEPTGARDLADEAARSEVRADHAERLAAIGTMASAVAHEIRNPLGIIRAEASLLERRGADARSVARLRDQVERASRFVDDLLRYSKPRPLEPAVVRVSQAIGRVVDDVRDGGDGGDETAVVAIELLIDPALELEADPGAFADVHTVLIHNALAAVHGRDGARIAVSGRAVDGVVELSVEDNGPGVPAEIEPRLFTPFVTGRGRDSAHPGTGLGLAIAARWVERHGGAIAHERPTGGGARFVVRWPRRYG